MEIQGGGRLQKHNFFERKYDSKLEFPEEGGGGGEFSN